MMLSIYVLRKLMFLFHTASQLRPDSPEHLVDSSTKLDGLDLPNTYSIPSQLVSQFRFTCRLCADRGALPDVAS